jgi:hypothetical protein
MAEGLKAMRLSEAAILAQAVTPAADNTAPLQLSAQADYELQRLDSKLFQWLRHITQSSAKRRRSSGHSRKITEGKAEEEKAWPQPETHAERQLEKLCLQALDHNLTSAYVLVRTRSMTKGKGGRGEERKGKEKGTAIEISEKRVCVRVCVCGSLFLLSLSLPLSVCVCVCCIESLEKREREEKDLNSHLSPRSPPSPILSLSLSRASLLLLRRALAFTAGCTTKPSLCLICYLRIPFFVSHKRPVCAFWVRH